MNLRPQAAELRPVPESMVKSLDVVMLLVGLRLAVVLLLVLGPWTDEAHELAGWDVARFQELADTPGRPYRDFDVEYPPGTLAALEVLAGPDVTVTHDRLVVVCLIADLLLAGTLAQSRGRPAAVAYLAMGTALLPIVYLRLDLVATLLGAVALLAATGHGRRAALGAGIALPLGFLVKLWPAALIPALAVARRWRAAALAIAGVGVATAAWMAWAGTGAVGQVVGYRGARGWHVESLVGAIVGLATGAPAVLESGSYRLGTAPGWARGALLAATLAATAAAWLAAWRRSPTPDDAPTAEPHDVPDDVADDLPAVVPSARPDDVADDRPAVVLDDLPAVVPSARPDAGPSARPVVLALAGLTTVAALLAGSALLSPQFLAWMLPFAALCWVEGERVVAGLAAAALLVTSATLAGFGPPGLANPVAESLLVLRGGLLVAVVVLGLRRLWRPPPLRGRARPRRPVAAGASAS